MAEGAGLHPGLLRSVLEINREARRRFVARADEMLGGLDGRQIAVWGLSFKEGTDDLRDSPAVEVVKLLVERGASVRAHDPAALANAAQRLPESFCVKIRTRQRQAPMRWRCVPPGPSTRRSTLDG
jgi:UDPglucose 6-dehydrogenase